MATVLYSPSTAQWGDHNYSVDLDGVGGTMKRLAGQMVLHGKDVTCAQELNSALQDYKISLFLIPSGDIEWSKSVVAELKVPPPSPKLV